MNEPDPELDEIAEAEAKMECEAFERHGWKKQVEFQDEDEAMIIESKLWNSCQDKPPPQGEYVRTMSAGGLEQTLRREGNLYFGRDDVYVYYDPQYWLPLERASQWPR